VCPALSPSMQPSSPQQVTGRLCSAKAAQPPFSRLGRGEIVIDYLVRSLLKDRFCQPCLGCPVLANNIYTAIKYMIIFIMFMLFEWR